MTKPNVAELARLIADVDLNEDGIDEFAAQTLARFALDVLPVVRAAREFKQARDEANPGPYSDVRLRPLDRAANKLNETLAALDEFDTSEPGGGG